MCARATPVERGLQRAGTGGDWPSQAHTGAPPRGDVRPCVYVIRVYKFLPKIYSLTPVLRPDCRVTSRITHSNKLFTLIRYKFMLFLSAVSAAKLTVMDPRPQ